MLVAVMHFVRDDEGPLEIAGALTGRWRRGVV